MRKFSALLTAAAITGLVTVTLAAPPPPATPPKGKDVMWGDIKSGIKFAQRNNLPMMISVTSNSCPWCKKLEAEVWPAAEVIALSQNFVCIKVDFDKEKEVVTHFAVKGKPTIIFTNSKAEELYRIPGYMPTASFLGEMKRALARVGEAKADSGGTTKTK